MDDNLRERFRSPKRGNYANGGSISRPSARSVSEYQTVPNPAHKPVKFHSSLPPRTVQFNNKPTPKKKSHKKLWISLCVLSVVVIAGASAYAFLRPKKQAPKKTTVKSSVQEQPTTSQPEFIRLIATGDMIAHNSVLENGKKPDGTYDFLPMMTNMKPYFDKAQVRFCNQATPAGGPQYQISGYPIFNAPLEWPRAIEGVGCNVVNIGTNHTNDKGQALIDATVASWDARPNVLAVVGASRSPEEQAKIRYFEQSGIKFSILSYTTYTNNKALTPYGINLYSKESATKQIAEARANSDIVLVSMRWGTEYSPDVNPEQDRVAQEVADAGADVIIGHGPHFMQPTKILKRSNGSSTLVWYSLGNFLNTQLETEALIGGFAVMDINTSTKQFVAPAFLPTYMHYDWTAADKKANNLSARKNLQMFALDQAAEPMSRSQLGTTVEAQTQRVTALLNKYTPVKILKSSEY